MKKLLLVLLIIFASIACYGIDTKTVFSLRKSTSLGVNDSNWITGKRVVIPDIPSWSSAVYSLSLDGVDDYAIASPAAGITPASWTMMCWYKSSVVPGNGEFRIILAALQNSTVHEGVGIAYPLASDAVVNFGNAWSSYKPIAVDTAWHHIALVRRADTSISVYVDAATLTAGINYASGIGITLTSVVWNKFPIGTYAGTLGTNTFKGRIAEVAYFSTVLTPEQIQTYRMQRMAGTEPNLIHLYHCDEGSGVSLTDSVSGGTNASLINGASWTSRL